MAEDMNTWAYGTHIHIMKKRVRGRGLKRDVRQRQNSRWEQKSIQVGRVKNKNQENKKAWLRSWDTTGINASLS